MFCRTAGEHQNRTAGPECRSFEAERGEGLRLGCLSSLLLLSSSSPLRCHPLSSPRLPHWPLDALRCASSIAHSTVLCSLCSLPRSSHLSSALLSIACLPKLPPRRRRPSSQSRRARRRKLLRPKKPPQCPVRHNTHSGGVRDGSASWPRFVPCQGRAAHLSALPPRLPVCVSVKPPPEPRVKGIHLILPYLFMGSADVGQEDKQQHERE